MILWEYEVVPKMVNSGSCLYIRSLPIKSNLLLMLSITHSDKQYLNAIYKPEITQSLQTFSITWSPSKKRLPTSKMSRYSPQTRRMAKLRSKKSRNQWGHPFSLNGQDGPKRNNERLEAKKKSLKRKLERAQKAFDEDQHPEDIFEDQDHPGHNDDDSADYHHYEFYEDDGFSAEGY